MLAVRIILIAAAAFVTGYVTRMALTLTSREYKDYVYASHTDWSNLSVDDYEQINAAIATELEDAYPNIRCILTPREGRTPLLQSFNTFGMRSVPSDAIVTARAVALRHAEVIPGKKIMQNTEPE